MRRIETEIGIAAGACVMLSDAQFATVCSALCLPLYFLAAWAMSYRSLSKGLKYRLPLSVQVRIPAIRKYWIWDLLLSAVAFAFFFFVLRVEYRVGQVFELFVDGQNLNRLHVIQPVLAFTLGVIWPTVSAVSVNTGTDSPSFSFGRLRDLLLGGQGIQTVNSHVEEIGDSYLRRVAEAMVSSDDSGLALQSATGVSVIGLAGDSEQRAEGLRTLLRPFASENLELLYLRVAKVKMIPLVDRRKPLMSVPSMTACEEARLFRDGVGLTKLVFGSAPREVDPARWAELRHNARAMIKQRSIGGLVLAFLTVAFVGGGLLLTPHLAKDQPIAGSEEPSPAAKSEADARGAPTTVYREPGH